MYSVKAAERVTLVIRRSRRSAHTANAAAHTAAAALPPSRRALALVHTTLRSGDSHVRRPSRHCARVSICRVERHAALRRLERDELMQERLLAAEYAQLMFQPVRPLDDAPPAAAVELAVMRPMRCELRLPLLDLELHLDLRQSWQGRE